MCLYSWSCVQLWLFLLHIHLAQLYLPLQLFFLSLNFFFFFRLPLNSLAPYTCWYWSSLAPMAMNVLYVLLTFFTIGTPLFTLTTQHYRELKPNFLWDQNFLGIFILDLATFDFYLFMFLLYIHQSYFDFLHMNCLPLLSYQPFLLVSE